MARRATSASRASRPRAVWIALIAAPTAIVMIALGVLVPVLALIGSADASTVGALDVPVGGIAVALLIGYGLAVLLTLVIARVRSAGLAWTLAISAATSALLVSVWPLIATAIAGAGQAAEFGPLLGELIGGVLPG